MEYVLRRRSSRGGDVKLSKDVEGRYRKQEYGKGPAIDGVTFHDLKRHHDDGGSMMELGRLTKGMIEAIGFEVAQVNYSTLEPGAIKAFHVHRRQTDVWFVPPEDRVLLVLADVRAGSRTEGQRVRILLGGGSSRLVRIPPGVAHGCRNLGAAPARILYLTDLHFSPDPDATDEGRLPWDQFGADVWEMARE
jgi:dTDP-4-dehydrorhamnose 3,5-epimerase